MKIVLEDTGFDWGEIDAKCGRCKHQYGCGIKKALHHLDNGIRDHAGLKVFLTECDNHDFWGKAGGVDET